MNVITPESGTSGYWTNATASTGTRRPVHVERVRAVPSDVRGAGNGPSALVRFDAIETNPAAFEAQRRRGRLERLAVRDALDRICILPNPSGVSYLPYRWNSPESLPSTG